MELIDDLCEVHKRRSGISLGMDSNHYADGSEWSENKKQKNAIHFECEGHNIARALNNFKQIHPYNMTAAQ